MASLLKRTRRTKAQLGDLLEAVLRITGEDPPISIRHLYYRLVGEDRIAKTEAGYINLCSLLTRWRKSSRLSFDVFADATRFYYGATLFDNMAEALESTAALYRRNLWAEQAFYVEVWAEKDAISSILLRAAEQFGVQVFTCRGFASLSSLANAAKTFRNAQAAGKQVRVLYFGDHDPSGRLIDKVAQRTLKDDFGVAVEFERVAVTPTQINSLKLPTRPTKKTGTHSQGFKGRSVEIDSISAAKLRGMVEAEITALIDPHQWQVMRQIEEEEKASLNRIWKKAA